MKHLYVPSTGPDDWKPLLAKPELHWKKGYSAKTLAHCWEACDGFPPEILNLFGQSAFPKLHEIECLLAIPEYQVPLPGGRNSSQNDLFVLARASKELVSITVEGKVNEDFGPNLRKWKSDGRPRNGKEIRLNCLKNQLGIKADIPESIRYQLLHRTASAVIAAQSFNAQIAVMVVHSFSPTNARFADYEAFLNLFGRKAEVGSLAFIRETKGIELYCGWAKGNPRFLEI